MNTAKWHRLIFVFALALALLVLLRGATSAEPDTGVLPSTSTKQVSRSTAYAGDRLTYTIRLANTGAPMTNTVLLTDVVPADLTLVAGTFTATSGVANSSNAPTLRWSGVFSPTSVVTITYAVTVSTPSSDYLANTAVIAAPGYETLTRTVGVLVNSRRFYLPMVMK